MASPSSAVNTQTSAITQRMALVEVWVTRGRSSVEPRFNFITPVALAIASTPDKAKMMLTKPAHTTPQSSGKGLIFWTAFPKWGAAKRISRPTTATVGIVTKNARLPVWRGPK